MVSSTRFCNVYIMTYVKKPISNPYLPSRYIPHPHQTLNINRPLAL